LQDLAERMRNVDVTPEVFAALKDGYRRGLQNRRFAEPYAQAQVDQRLLLEHPSVPDEALLEALGPVTLEQVQEYARHLFDRVYVQGVVVGNLDPEQARQGIQKLLETLHSRPLPRAQRVEEQVQPLPEGADSVLAQRLAVSNSLALVYSQAGQTTPTLRAALQLIARPLEDSYYFNLRTQQQLGYIVYAGTSQIQKTLGLAMLAQSGTYPADVLLARTEAFVPRFIAQFQDLPQQSFDQYRMAVLQSKLQRDKTLDDTAQRLFYTAFRNDADWDYLSADLRATEALRKPVVLRLLQQTLAAPSRRRLVIELFGKDAPARPARGRVVRLPQTLQPAG
ncbi:MAG TPA: insulinase family protein, partial [bacterium]|nr:insulinase family protein [bacterium]